MAQETFSKKTTILESNQPELQAQDAAAAFRRDIKRVTESNEKVGKLVDFDDENGMEYFHSLEGADGWIAIDNDYCKNSKYFVVLSQTGERLGIVGVYDAGEEKNITHTVVDPKYRGQRLAIQFKEFLMDELGLDFITLTIDLDNTASIRAAEKLPGIKKVSDGDYESNYHKVKYIYTR